MKKKTAITVLSLIVAGFCLCSYITTHYTREATVKEVTSSGIMVTDRTGEAWYYENPEESFQIGDEVKLKMYNNQTDEDITDDIINKVIKTED